MIFKSYVVGKGRRKTGVGTKIEEKEKLELSKTLTVDEQAV